MLSAKDNEGSADGISDAAISGEITTERVQMIRVVLASFEQRISAVEIKKGQDGFTAPGTWLMRLLGEMNITAASKGEFLEVLDGIIDLYQTYRPTSKCYLETFKKAIQIILFDGLTPEIAAR